jgi:hypothetical protein
MRHKYWYNKRKALYSLQQDDVFSSEELDLLMQRINEELEYASSDILRIWEKESKNTSNTDY